MKSNSDIYFSLILLVMLFIRAIHSVPHEFCLDQFDEDDCGESPTHVFYYYKSGSRCEIRTWRGCPTLNRFPDEFSCLHFCVMRNWGGEGEALMGITEDPKEEWIEDLVDLKVEDMEAIDDILEEVVQEVEHNPEKLTASNPEPDEIVEEEQKEGEATDEDVSEGEPDEVITT